MLIKLKEDVPLLGALFIGVVDRGTNLLQVRATTVCNLNCEFCSTDSGICSKFHKANFEVSVDSLVKWVKEAIRLKELPKIDILIDSVGNPFCYPKMEELVSELKKIKEVGKISTQANGMMLSPEKIKKLEKAGLGRINLSLISLDPEQSIKLSGVKNYDLKHVLKIIDEIKKSKIELLITPVYIPGVNNIEEIIQFCKEKEIKLGIQNYEVHKYGRKIKNSKKMSWWKFYELLKRLEKKYNIKLKLGPNDFGIKRSKKIPLVFDKNEKVSVEIVSEGWSRDQCLAKSRDRLISVNDCKGKPGDRINVKILDNKNGIYMAKLL